MSSLMATPWAACWGWAGCCVDWAKSQPWRCKTACPSSIASCPARAISSPPRDSTYTAEVVNQSFDLVICLDASSPDRMGNAYNPAVHASGPAARHRPPHHQHASFGAVNWVAPTCAATCQMLAYLADALDVTLDGELAECLLTGLVTDTLCFRTANTDAAVLEVAMRLMRGGADLATITQRTVSRHPFSLIKLWGLILPGVHLEDGVIWSVATPPMFAEAGHPFNDISLSSFLVTADEADMSAVFIEKPDDETGEPTVECSFRAKPGFNVAQSPSSSAAAVMPRLPAAPSPAKGTR